MSRIFLISLNTCTHPCEIYPLGIAVVAAVLERDGHEVCMYDYLVVRMKRMKPWRKAFRIAGD